MGFIEIEFNRDIQAYEAEAKGCFEVAETPKDALKGLCQILEEALAEARTRLYEARAAETAPKAEEPAG